LPARIPARDQNAFALLQNYGARANALLDERHGRAQRVIAPGDPAIHASLGLAKEDVDARAQMLFAPRA
jgi:hypothetical protein